METEIKGGAENDGPGSLQRMVRRQRRVKQTLCEKPPGSEWCKDAAMRLVSMSDVQDFRDGETWGKWCRSVIGAGLMQDAARLEWLAKDAGYPMPPNAKADLAGGSKP